MSTVYSIRMPKQLREALEGLRRRLAGRTKDLPRTKGQEEYMKKQMEEARTLRSKTKLSIDSAEMIRKDRENAH